MHTRARQPLPRDVDARIRRAGELLWVHLADPDPLARLPGAVNLSASRLRHLFGREVGMPPREYLRICRLESARALLTETFLSVKEVARAVGAGDVSHFVRDFKTRFGESPTRYRRQAAQRPPLRTTSDSANE